MGYMSHCPYRGTPYAPGGDGRDVNGHDSFTRFCDACCPEYQRAADHLDAAWQAVKDAVREDNRRRGLVNAAGEGYSGPTVKSSRELVELSNAAGAAALAHDRYGWAPTIGGPCSVCGEDC